MVPTTYDPDADEKYSPFDQEMKNGSSSSPMTSSSDEMRNDSHSSDSLNKDSGSSSPKSFDSNELSGKESDPGTEASDAGKSEKEKIGSKLANHGDEWATNVSAKKKGKGSRKKWLLAGGGGAGLLLVGAFFLLMFFASSLKHVHFATVLRSTGFAAGQLVTRKIFTQVAYDAAVMTESSTGSLTKPQRTYLDRIRRVNAAKTMDILGTQNRFNIQVDNSEVKGFRVNGKDFTLDDFAKDNFKGKSYNDLTFRERLTVKNKVLGTIGDEMSRVLAVEPRRFQTGFFKGVRTHFNIRTSTWAVKARDLAGKNPIEAEAETRAASVEAIEGGEIDPAKLTDVPEIEEGAKATRAERLANMKKGIDMRGKDSARRALSKVGLNGNAAYSAAGKTAAKVSIAVLVSTVYCTARDINNSLDEINKTKEEQAQRFSHDIQTTSDQIQSGEIVAEAAGAASAQWDGTANTGDIADVPPAESSPFYMAAFGKPTNNLPKENYEGIPNGSIDNSGLTTIINIGDTILTSAPLLFLLPSDQKKALIDQVCSVVLNPAAQWTIAGADVVFSVLLAGATGGTTEAIKTGIKAALFLGGGLFAGNELGKWIEESINNASGSGTTGMESGIEKYNAGQVATDYQNTTLSRGLNFGRPLDTSESKNTKTIAMEAERQYQNKRPFMERYFAINHPYSITGRVAAIAPTNFSSFAMRTRLASTNLLAKSPVGTFSDAFGTAFTALSGGTLNKAYAAGTQDFSADNNFFGVPQWGWSADEIERIEDAEKHPTYTTIENGGWVEERNANGELDTKYNKCFKPAANTEVPKEGCDSATLKSEEAFRWRYYKATLAAVESLADTEITEEDGGESKPPTTGELPTDTVTEADTAVTAGCGGIRVHTSIVKSLDELCSAASGDGLNLTGSGWRSPERQIELRKQNCPDWQNSPPSACSPPTAKPGSSNHERGLAIDFSNCGSRSTACYKWLAVNAERFKFYNLPSESWHWSVDGK